jgi:hypothetical protein
MSQRIFFTAFSLILFLTGLIVSACGGGSGDSGRLETFTISGQLITSNGSPVVAATVIITSDPVTAVTDSQGNFSTLITSGDHSIVAVKNGEAFLTTSFSTQAGSSMDLGALGPTIPFYLWFPDSDGDDYGILAGSIYATIQPADFTSLSGDCNDTDPTQVGCYLLIDDDAGINNEVGEAVIGDPIDVDHIFRGDLDALGILYDIRKVRTEYADGPVLSDLQKYDLIIWFTGALYTDPGDPWTLTASDQASLTSYLEGGGRLFLSGQDILSDIGLDSFAANFLGVQAFDEDNAHAMTVLGISGDPVSDSLRFSGCDSDGDDQIDNFATKTVITLESGSALWESTAMPGTLTLTATTTSSVAPTVFTGVTQPIDNLMDDVLEFGGHSYWGYTNSAITPYVTDYWYDQEDIYGPNHYFKLFIDQETYVYFEHKGADYQPFPDVLNPGGHPAHAHTLLLDGAGGTVATRVQSGTWKVIFLAYPYEGLNPTAERRVLLDNAIQWLIN